MLGWVISGAWADCPSPRTVEVADSNQAVLARFVQAQYSLTQQLLEGIDAVVLYRSVRSASENEGRTVDPSLQPLSSFSLEAEIAQSLATHGLNSAGGGDYVLTMCGEVPRSRILSTPVTGFGSLLERELVVGWGVLDDRLAVDGRTQPTLAPSRPRWVTQ